MKKNRFVYHGKKVFMKYNRKQKKKKKIKREKLSDDGCFNEP